MGIKRCDCLNGELGQLLTKHESYKQLDVALNTEEKGLMLCNVCVD